MAGGFIVMARRIFEHQKFDGDTFSRRDAFMWLVAEAAWKDQPPLKRGQLSHSVRFMAVKFGWTAPKVQRFLASLKADTMIETVADTGQTVITICNYDKYQNSKRPSETGADTASDTKKNKKKQIEEKKEERTSARTGCSLPVDWRPSDEDLAYAEGQGFTRTSAMDQFTDMQMWAFANANRAVARKASWSLTFRGWIRRKKSTGSTTHGTAKAKFQNAYDALCEHNRERREAERSEGRSADVAGLLPLGRRLQS